MQRQYDISNIYCEPCAEFIFVEIIFVGGFKSDVFFDVALETFPITFTDQ